MNYNITVSEVLKYIEEDKTILKIYDDIEKYELGENGRAFHNFEHVKNVMTNAVKLLTDLNFDEETITSCKIACLLHDIGSLQGKEGHAERSYEFAQKYFQDHNWHFQNLENILDAIKNHSSGFESNNILTTVIVLADKLDVKKNRISEEGKKYPGNRQYSHINDITINTTNNLLTVNFITDGALDLKETNEYYFTAKIFNAIKSFSEKMHLDYSILLDNNKWEL